MERKILWMANFRRQKMNVLAIGILLAITMLSLATVLSLTVRSNRSLVSELDRLGYGDVSVWVRDSDSRPTIERQLNEQESVEELVVQDLIFADYQHGDIESDSEGQLIAWSRQDLPYRFFAQEGQTYRRAPKRIPMGEVYVSPSMKSILSIDVGDSITFSIGRNGQDINLRVAGFYEDPAMGSSMIGMKGFLIGPEQYAEIVQMLDDAGANALASQGTVFHVRVDGSLPRFLERLESTTDIYDLAEFVYSTSTLVSFMTILQNVYMALMAAFSLVLMLVVYVLLGYTISHIIEQDWKNFGRLKTLGLQARTLIHGQLLLYGSCIGAASLLGVLASIPLSKRISFWLLPSLGVRIPADMPWLGILVLVILSSLFFLFFAWVRLRTIETISPMDAISPTQKHDSSKKHGRIHAKGLLFSLSLRQVWHHRRHYIGVGIVALLLVFFASISLRMNDWLGPNGQGMMDDFNPAELDIGIQSLGNLSSSEVEQIVESYSPIRDHYALAMPNVTVSGRNVSANVITDPSQFHIQEGRTVEAEDEVVLTETIAHDLGLEIGDSLSIRADRDRKNYRVVGIYVCANDMGENLGLSREGYLRIGSDDPNLWCHHYYLEDTRQIQGLIQRLETTYGGDIHVHQNTWPGLASILQAMHALLLVIALLTTSFVAVITWITGRRILEIEKRDMGIFRAIGICANTLRGIFTLRFGIVAFIGAVIGTMMAHVFADPLVSIVMRMAGISSYASSPHAFVLLVPAAFVIVLFVAFSSFVSRKLKIENGSVLTVEE